MDEATAECCRRDVYCTERCECAGGALGSGHFEFAADLRVEDERGEFSGGGEVEALRGEDLLAPRGDHDGAFVGGEDLFDVAGRGVCGGSAFGGIISMEAGVLAAEGVGVELGEGLC